MTAGADPAAIHAAVAATWPAARTWRQGPVTLRDGQGGGSRVSAATVEAGWTESDIVAAEAEMGARPLFMLREGEERLDALLAARGYAVMDPVVGYVAPVGVLATVRPPPVTTFEVWPVLAAQREIWAEGGIGPARIAVMERAARPKVSLLGRLDDSPAGAAFVAVHQGFGMVHALEVLPRFRRRGLGAHLLRAAAFWVAGQGAGAVGLVVTEANAGARALYEAMGMQVVARYHYRVRKA
jgi:ribosomal protein S18 acetylase RimI-like enzyme